MPFLTLLFICIFNALSPLCLSAVAIFGGLSCRGVSCCCSFLHCISFYCFRSGIFFFFFWYFCRVFFRIFVVLNFPRDSPHGNILFLLLLSSAVNRFGGASEACSRLHHPDSGTPPWHAIVDTHHAAGQPHFGNPFEAGRLAQPIASLFTFQCNPSLLRFLGVWCCCWQQVVGPSNTSRTVRESAVQQVQYHSCLPEFTGYPIGHRHSIFSVVFTIRGAVLSFFNSYSFLMYHQIRRLVALGTFRTGHVISGNAGMPHVAQAR